MFNSNNVLRSGLRNSRISFVLIIFSLTMETYGSTAFANYEWQHKDSKISIDIMDSFNVRLYAQNENLLMRFSDGHTVFFKPESDQFGHRILRKKTHRNKHLGRIDSHGSRRTWHTNQNIEIEFLGSYPIVLSSDARQLNLNYDQQQLVSVDLSNDSSQTQPTTRIQFIDLITSVLSQTEQLTCPAEESAEQCTDNDAPLPAGFNTSSEAHILHINIRPTDCHSFFTTFPSIERGTEIEAALAHQPPYFGSESGAHSFPVADYWNNGDVYVLISRDLTADSYLSALNPEGFYDQLISDGLNIQENLIQPLETNGEITQTSLGETTTLHETQAQVIYLDVVVQFGVMTAAQEEQFNRAAEELLSQYGIILRLVMIP